MDVDIFGGTRQESSCGWGGSDGSHSVGGNLQEGTEFVGEGRLSIVLEELLFGDSHLHGKEHFVEEFDFWFTINISVESDMDGSVVIEIVVGSTDVLIWGIFVVDSDLVSKINSLVLSVWVNSDSSNGNHWGERNWVLVHEDDPILFLTDVLFSYLDLMGDVGWVLSGVGHVVNLV